MGKNLLSALIGLLGFVVLFYVGGYLVFFNGLMQLIDAIKTTPITTRELALGIVRTVFGIPVASVISLHIFKWAKAILE